MTTGTVGRVIHAAAGILLVAILAVEGVLLAAHAGPVGAVFAHANLAFVALALALELVSWLAFAALPQRMLAGGGLRVPLSRLLVVLLAGNAISATLPAGSALANGYTFLRFRRAGASMPLAAWALLISGLISGATLGALGVAAALLVGSDRMSSVAAAAALGMTIGLAVALRVAAQHPAQLARVARSAVRLANRLGRRAPSRGVERVAAFVDQIVLIRPRGRDWLAGAGFATINWAADVACLVLACRAMGITDLSPRLVVIVYAADAVAGAVQLIPGGIGLVEGAMVAALVGGGIPFAEATGAVILYRVISFGLVTLVGWLVWLGLRDSPRRVEKAALDRSPSMAVADSAE